MATVKLSNYECRRDLLPQVCMFCGAPAVTRVKRTFSWCPGWVWILILVNLIVVLVVALILTKKMTVRVPTCHEHEGYWRRKNVYVGLSFVAIVLISVGGLVIASSQAQGGGNDPTGFVCVGSSVLFFAWLVVAAIASARGVRAVHITDDTVKLTGVHEEFVTALREERAADRDDRSRFDRYGDERDDYDDRHPDDEPRRRRPRRDRYDDDDRRRGYDD
jgi:hypothetical protein